MQVNVSDLKKALKAINSDTCDLYVSSEGIVIRSKNISLYVYPSELSDEFLLEKFAGSIIVDALLLPISEIRVRNIMIKLLSENGKLIGKYGDKTIKIDFSPIPFRSFWIEQQGILIEDSSNFYGFFQLSKGLQTNEFLPITHAVHFYANKRAFQMDCVGMFENLLYFQKTTEEFEKIRKEFSIEYAWELADLVKRVRPQGSPQILFNQDYLTVVSEEFRYDIALKESKQMLFRVLKGLDYKTISDDDYVVKEKVEKNSAAIKYKSRRLSMMLIPPYQIAEEERFYSVQNRSDNSILQYVITKQRKKES